MANPVIIPKKSVVAQKVPTSSDLALGEICINHADRKIYSRDPASGNINQIAASPTHSHSISDVSGLQDALNNAGGGGGGNIQSLDVSNLVATAPNGTTAYCKDAKGFGLYPNNQDQQSMVYKSDESYYSYDGNIEVIPNGPSLWKVGSIFNDYNPDTEAFNTTTLSATTNAPDGIYRWIGRIDCTINGKYIKIAVTYAVKESLRVAGNVPCVISIHGWGGNHTNASNYVQLTDFVSNNYAVIAYDWRGEYTDSGTNRTLYPVGSGLAQGINPNADTANQSSATDISGIRELDMYYWQAMSKRVLSFARSKTEIDNTNIGIVGHSWGGTLAWCFGGEERVKAIVSYYGAGWKHYSATKNNFGEGNNRYVSALEPEGHLITFTRPILYLNGTNEFHGLLPYVLYNFDILPSTTPASWSLEPNEAHNVHPNTDQNVLLWMNKYLKNAATTWYDAPTFVESLVPVGQTHAGYPMVTVAPDTPNDVSSVEVRFAINSLPTINDVGSELWVDATVVANGDGTWKAETPTPDVDLNIYVYTQITYSNNVVVASRLKSFVPSDLGNATPSTGQNPAWTPLELTASTIDAWYDASDTNTIVETSGSVSQLNDKSGNTKNLIQATSTSRPAIVSNSQNGLSTINFSTTNQFLMYVNATLGAVKWTDIFLVWKFPYTSFEWNGQYHWNGIVSCDRNSPAFFGLGIYAQTERTYQPGQVSPNGLRYTDRIVDNSHSIRVNDIARPDDVVLPTMSNDYGILHVTHSSTTARDWYGIALNRLVNFANSGSKGNFAECLVLNTNPTTSDREKICGYLAWKWGIQAGLAADHPYKTFAPIV